MLTGACKQHQKLILPNKCASSIVAGACGVFDILLLEADILYFSHVVNFLYFTWYFQKTSLEDPSFSINHLSPVQCIQIFKFITEIKLLCNLCKKLIILNAVRLNYYNYRSSTNKWQDIKNTKNIHEKRSATIKTFVGCRSNV
jgi:hypothetical protein